MTRRTKAQRRAALRETLRRRRTMTPAAYREWLAKKQHAILVRYREEHREYARQKPVAWRARPENRQRKKDYDNGWWVRFFAVPGNRDAYNAECRLYAKERRAYLKQDPERYRAILDKINARIRARYERTVALHKPGRAESLTAAIMRQIPRSVHPDVRLDLCQELAIAVLTGETTLERLPEVMRKYTARARKLLAETWGQRSLDDEKPGRFDGLTYKEALADDCERF